MLASLVLDEEIRSPVTQLKLIRTTVQGAVGKSLADADFRNRTGSTVVAAERNGSVITNPGASFVLESGDDLVVAGTDENINRFQGEFPCWLFSRPTMRQRFGSSREHFDVRLGGRLRAGGRRGGMIPRPKATA